MTNMQRYALWCEKVTDAKLRQELKAMQDNPTAIDNAFYQDLAFGTAGLRGEIGAGTNCLNIYTIAKTTQGIADNMKKHGHKTVAISYDSRINSDVFSVKTAEVFAANGIKAYLSRECMPVPYLSFLTRALKADIGVMITASHNPAKYNGYKVYGPDGCQLTDARSGEMISYINQIDPFAVHTGKIEDYIKQGLIAYAPDEIEKQFLAVVKKQSCGNCESNIRIAYTPLNGAGYRLVPEIFKQIGVTDLHIVPEQAKPDGRFLTCSYPNPEKAEALKLGLELSEKVSADILIATDPDADRMGIAVKTQNGYRLMSGNETGVLLTDYLFSRRSALGTLPKNPVMVKTIVSTELAVRIAADYGAQTFNVLTGFKYIGEIIKGLEVQSQEDRFVFGFEESYGYLAGSHVRDKDAVVASMLIAEAAAYYKKQGITLADRIAQLYAQYGTYSHKLISKEFPGADGSAKMKKLLADLRAALPQNIGGVSITKSIDYLTQTEFNLPRADILSFNLADGCQLIIRPSGTEPLIKMYLTAAKTPAENQKAFARLESFINEVFT